MIDDKTKDKGTVKTKILLTANAVGVLNGEHQLKSARVPFFVLNYTPPPTAHPFAQGERFALWFKLDQSEHRAFISQIKKDYRELTIWLNWDNLKALKRFINEIEGLE